MILPKTIWSLLLTTFFVLPGILQAYELPENWCSSENCHPSQEKMWDSFQTGFAPDWSQLPAVYSGSCFHVDPYMDSEIEQHAGFLIDTKDNGIAFTGVFSYFAKSNPFADMDVKAARQRWSKTGDQRRIEQHTNYSFYNANPGVQNPNLYWIRQNAAGDLLLAVQFINPRWVHTALCHLLKNPYRTSFTNELKYR